MISSNIFTKDNFKLNRQPHIDDSIISKYICDIHRSKFVKIKKTISRLEYYYDDYFDEFYLLNYDKRQKIYRPYKISHYGFYPILYKELIRFVKLD